MWLFFYRFYLPERQKSSRGELEENNDQKTVPLASIALRRLTRAPSPEDTRTSGDMASSGPSGGATRTLRPPPTRLCVITQVKDQTPPPPTPSPGLRVTGPFSSSGDAESVLARTHFMRYNGVFIPL